MTENGFKDKFVQSGNQPARRDDTEKSPWNKFLSTLDANPKMSDGEVMTLFAKTLSTARSDWKDSNDNTLLMHMASRGKTGVAKRLIHELYADVNATNKDGLTALHMAARGGFKAVCSELMDSHANPAIKDKNGSRPSDLARQNGHEDLAHFLKIQETAKDVWQHGQHGHGY